MVSIKVIHFSKQLANIFTTSIISTVQVRQSGRKDLFQILLKYMEKLTLTS